MVVRIPIRAGTSLPARPIRSIALDKGVGFEYQYDPKTQQYAHAAAIVMLSPDHHISGYFYGVEFSPKDLRLGLVQASQGKVGNIGDQVLLYCYHYDPGQGNMGRHRPIF